MNEQFLKECGNRIKAQRIALNMTQEELCKRSGYNSRTAMNKIEAGAIDLPQSKIIAIAKALKCTPAYIMGWTNDTTSESNFQPVNEFILFPEIGTIRAGYDGTINKEYTGESVQITPAMLNGRSPEDYFVLRVKGNSMYPRILEGDVILCLRTDSVDSGDIAVVIYDGEEATVKKVNYVSGEDWLELIPYNPEYQTKRIKGADLELCHIQGKVVKLIRDI